MNTTRLHSAVWQEIFMRHLLRLRYFSSHRIKNETESKSLNTHGHHMDPVHFYGLVQHSRSNLNWKTLRARTCMGAPTWRIVWIFATQIHFSVPFSWRALRAKTSWVDWLKYGGQESRSLWPHEICLSSKSRIHSVFVTKMNSKQIEYNNGVMAVYLPRVKC